MEEVARALVAVGHDVDKVFSSVASVTKEWAYSPAGSGKDPCVGIVDRLKQQREQERRVPLQLKSLKEVLNPQPTTAGVLLARHTIELSLLVNYRRCSITYQHDYDFFCDAEEVMRGSPGIYWYQFNWLH